MKAAQGQRYGWSPRRFSACRVVGSLLALTLVVALGALAMLSVGFVIGSFARNEDVAKTLSMLISFPMMFLAGSYFPPPSAPSFLQPLIAALPFSHLNDALRAVINNGAGLAAWMCVALAISFRAFRWA